MRLSVGDVIVGFHRDDDVAKIYRAAFGSSVWSRLHEDRLRRAFVGSVIFGVLFENMPTALATKLHDALENCDGYLGLLSVHFEFGPHLALYRNSLPSKYRLKGTSCRAFFSMGEEDGKDMYDLAEMRTLGYVDVDWEDRGAHGTIFDSFDTLRHFERVAAFRKAISPLLLGGDDAAYELVMVLEDLDPKLFNALGAAIERLMAAEIEEDVAQAALSGRRYMEQLADALFPPSDTKRGGRSVGKSAYRNRLWAFVEDNVGGNTDRQNNLGAEIDRLVDELNGGLHGDRPKQRIMRAFADAAQLTAELLALNPDTTRKPYYAFRSSIEAFFQESVALRGAGKAD